MASLWTLSRIAGPTATALALRGRDFSPREAERLSAVLQRDLRGEFQPLEREDKQRALFICWLKDHGRLTDHPADQSADAAERFERVLIVSAS
ncbi:MAG TPA: hypothetical protein VFN74_25595 [Chloroflexota bacterium]|nr:hypothetical protein [Chloroflexota bacterium]